MKPSYFLFWALLAVFFTEPFVLKANQGNPYENTIYRASLGESFSAEIKNGALFTWGQNNFGQLGIGDTLPKVGIFSVNSASDWKQVSTGSSHGLAIKTDGTLWAWGNNQNGELGTGDFNKRSTPTEIGLNKKWIYVQAASNHSIGLTSDGELWSWGDNTFGQLGTGNNINQSTPIQVGNNFDWTQITTKGNFSLAKKVDGTIWAWGENQLGQCGDNTTTNVLSPKQIGNNDTWKEVFAGKNHAGAITSYGAIFLWGDNNQNQIDSTSTAFYNSPQKINIGKNFTKLALGENHSIALKANGSIWGWGSNQMNQISSDSLNSIVNPIKINNQNNWVAIYASKNSTFGLQAQGSLKGWGDNTSNQIIDSNATIQNPILISKNNSEWVSLNGGPYTTVAIQSNGNLFVFGDTPANGAWGYFQEPQKVGNDSNWVAGFAGQNHYFGLKADGTLWAWGYGQNGKLGNGASNNQQTDIQVDTSHNWLEAGGTSISSLALKADGTVWTWGWNFSGNLGSGSANNTIRNIPGKMGIDSTWINIDAGISFLMAQKSDGTLWGWGKNTQGQLGTGGTSDYAYPYPVNGSNSFKRFVCGGDNGFGLTADGRLFGWGFNNSGELGKGSTGNSNFPTQVNSSNTWIDISAGQGHSLALRENGELWGWGTNGLGQLSLSTNGNNLSPVLIDSTESWYGIFADGQASLLIKNQKATYCGSGRNDRGKLANGTYSNISSISCNGDLINLFIAKNPQSQNVCDGYDVGFKVEVINALSLQWQYSADGGANWLTPTVGFTGQNTDSLTLQNTDSTFNNFQFRCVFVGQLNNDTSNMASLVVDTLPNIFITGDDEICVGDSSIIMANGGDSYLWNTGVTFTSFPVNPTTTTTYSVVGTNTATSCKNSSSFTVKVNPLPNAVITGSNLICNGSSVTLTASGGDVFQWSSGSTSNQITITPPSSVSVFVTVTNSLTSCKKTASKVINLKPMPDTSVTMSYDSTINVSYGSYFLKANGQGNYRWLNCDNNFSLISGQATNTIYPQDTINNYALKIDLNGCIDTSACFEISRKYNSVGQEDLKKASFKFFQTTDLVTITFEKSGNRKLDLLDALGRTLKSSQSNSNIIEFQLNDFASGLYFFNIYENNRRIDVIKLYR